MANFPNQFNSSLLWALILLAMPLAGSEPQPDSPQPFDAVVVRPAAWAEAIRPWKAYRESQGHRIAEIDSAPDRELLRAAISKLVDAQSEPLRYVLLAGDVSADAATSIPTFYHDSTAMSQFGGDAKIASDNPYADLDGDGYPELSIGRIPADSAAQLQQVLARAISFEQKCDFSTWRRDVHVVAGVGGFGPVADSVIELTTRRFLASRIPGWSELSMTQASIESHYCPDPWRFSEACIGRMNQGGMFWVYIGHGHVKTLDYMHAGDEWLPILTRDHVPAIDVGSHPPIAVFLACYTGAFDAIEDSLAEELMLSPTGPIAALAASRVSGPYGLAMLSDGLLSSCFDDQIATLGEVVLRAKQHSLKSTPEQTEVSGRVDQLQMIGAIASALSPSDYDLAAERQEHVWQMNLLGDPLLRLCHPGALEIEVVERAAPGETIRIAGSSDVSGELLVELVWRRDHIRKDLDTVAVDLLSERGRAGFQQRYQAANQRIILKHDQSLDAPGDFHIDVCIPEELPRGKYAVRAFLSGDSACRVGYQELMIRAAE